MPLAAGAGSLVLESKRHAAEPSLRIDRIDLKSCASEYETCMDTGIAHKGSPRAAALLHAALQRWTRRCVRPAARLVSRTSVWIIVTSKRLLPFQFSSYGLLDRLGIWILREPELMPTTFEGLMGHAVIRHDVNMCRLIIDAGERLRAPGRFRLERRASPDFSMDERPLRAPDVGRCLRAGGVFISVR